MRDHWGAGHYLSRGQPCGFSTSRVHVTGHLQNRASGGWKTSAKSSVAPGHSGAQLDQRQNHVDGGGRRFGKLSKLLNRGDEGVDFHRPAGIQVLPHGGAVGADSGAAVDPPVHVDREPDAELFGDLLCFDHHGARHRAGPRIGAEHIQRGMGQCRDRVERQVAPELDPDLVADARAHGGLEARGAQHF